MQPKYLLLSELLQNKLFVIPSHQRTYSWGNKERSDLFNDIKSISISDREHFMSTLVVLSRKLNKKIKSNQYELLELTDGQQRTTSLIILLKSISKYLHNIIAHDRIRDGVLTEEEKKEIKPNIDLSEVKEEIKEIDSLLVKGDTNKTIILELNHDDNNIFRDFLISGTIPEDENILNVSDKNLCDAFKQSVDFIKDWSCNDPKKCFELLHILKNKLGFVLYQIEDESLVYRTFETLNSRGVAVDDLDKLRNILMGQTYENSSQSSRNKLIEKLRVSWAEIYKQIGLTNISKDEILKFSATLQSKLSKIMGGPDAIELFHEKAKKDDMSCEAVLDWILQVTKTLKEITNNSYKKAVIKVAHARLLLVAILLVTKDQKVILQFENTTFKIFGLFRKDSRFKVGDYLKLAQYIIETYYNKTESQEKINNDIIQKLCELGAEFKLEDVSKFMSSIDDFYNGWENEARYLLYRYEQHLSKVSDAEVQNEIWDEIFSHNANKTLDRIVFNKKKTNNDIGNILVVRPNVVKEDEEIPFAEKKLLYEAKLCNLLISTKEVLANNSWTEEAINNRKKVILDWITLDFKNVA